jgi:hypothetical protein
MAIPQSVPLKPLLPIFTILEKAWNSYKSFFKKLWPLSLATIGVGAVLVIASEAGFVSTVLFAGQKYDLSASTAVLVSSTIYVLFCVVGIFLAGVFLCGVADLYKGDYQGVGTTYLKGFKIFWPFAVVSIAFGLILISGEYLIFIPGIILFVYLLFSGFEFMVEDKRGFDALLGSWALVKDRWWAIFGKLLLVGLLLGLVIFVVEIAIAILLAILSVIAALLHLWVILIVFGVLCAVAIIGAIILLVYPMILIVYFELYFNLKETRISSNTEAGQNVKVILVMFMVLGILAFAVMPILWNRQLQNFHTSLDNGLSLSLTPKVTSIQVPVSNNIPTTTAPPVSRSSVVQQPLGFVPPLNSTYADPNVNFTVRYPAQSDWLWTTTKLGSQGIIFQDNDLQTFNSDSQNPYARIVISDQVGPDPNYKMALQTQISLILNDFKNPIQVTRNITSLMPPIPSGVIAEVFEVRGGSSEMQGGTLTPTDGLFMVAADANNLYVFDFRSDSKDFNNFYPLVAAILKTFDIRH